MKTMNKQNRIVLTGMGLVFSLQAGLTGAQTSAVSAPPALPPAPVYASDEYLVLGNTNRGAGEPMVAVNPKDPKNIVVVGMSTWHQIEGMLPDLPGTPPPPGAGNRSAALMKGLRTHNSTIMTIAVTKDGGITWKHMEDTIRHDTHSRCADPIAAAGPDGTFYVGCINREPVGEFLATDAMSISHDGGDTWGPPIMLIGNDRPYREYAPGLNPIHNETISSPFDRPWIEVDQSNNALYMFVANGSTGEPPRRQSYLIGSRDGGKNWGLIYSIDSPEWPQVSGGSLKVGHGSVAAIYVASSVPASTGAKCPCLVFALSKDDGKTYERRVVPGYTPPAGGGGGGGASLAADDSKPGRYAFMSAADANTKLQVWMTEDYGKTWSGPTLAGQTPGGTVTKSWINFGPRGDLAVVWRGPYPDRSYDFFSSLSRDGGKSFSAPLKVSHAPSPPLIRERGNYLFGDDISHVVLDATNVHMVWGDSRAGFQGTWYGRVPIAAYK